MGIIFPKNQILSSINGILAMVFGLVAILFPSITVIGLAIYFGITFLLGGITLTALSIKHKRGNLHWRLMMLEGLLGIFVALAIFFNPTLSATIFVFLIGVWAILNGVVFLAAYFKRKVAYIGKGLLIITGIVSLLFGILIISDPFESTKILTIIIGIYAIAYGILSIITKTNTNNFFNQNQYK